MVTPWCAVHTVPVRDLRSSQGQTPHQRLIAASLPLWWTALSEGLLAAGKPQRSGQFYAFDSSDRAVGEAYWEMALTLAMTRVRTDAVKAEFP
jgi:hypothetical protein